MTAFFFNIFAVNTLNYKINITTKCTVIVLNSFCNLIVDQSSYNIKETFLTRFNLKEKNLNVVKNRL